MTEDKPGLEFHGKEIYLWLLKQDMCINEFGLTVTEKWLNDNLNRTLKVWNTLFFPTLAVLMKPTRTTIQNSA